jgi:hypothetical protein
LTIHFSLATGKIGVSAPLAKLHSTLLFNTIVANLVLFATKLHYQSSTPIPIQKHISHRPAQTMLNYPLLTLVRHLQERDSTKRLKIDLSWDSFHLLIVPPILCVQERPKKGRQLWVLEMLMRELAEKKRIVFPFFLWTNSCPIRLI